MAYGKRKHLTESIGVKPRVYTVSNKSMPEINTVHSFGPQGNETSGWPFRSTGIVGTPIGPNRLYRPPRLSQNELGSKGRRPHRRRKHPTESLGA